MSAAKRQQPTVEQLCERVLQGQTLGVARALRWVDDEHPQTRELLMRLFAHTGRARLVGITGSPGAGKSTLTDQLIGRFRGQGKKVGVLAVDPSSPFTGGAILGDRIRMNRHSGDEGVFIRSLATRGALGGLTRSTVDSIKILDAAGFDEVIIETVGVGQDEVDVIKAVETIVVVLTPGAGDDIQAIKAGILEIGDIFVINKADRAGAQKTIMEIEAMLELNEYDEADWKPPVLPLVAFKGQGLDELAAAIEAHREFCERTEEGARRRERRILEEYSQILQQEILQAVVERLGGEGSLEQRLREISAQNRNPYAEISRLVADVLGESTD